MKRLKSFQMPSLPIQQQIESTLPNCLVSQSTSSLPPPPPPPIDTNMEKVSHLSCGELTHNAVNGIDGIGGDVSLQSSENPDIFNVVLQQSQEGNSVSESRPRQYGRRSNPMRISSMVVPESLNHTAAVNI